MSDKNQSITKDRFGFGMSISPQCQLCEGESETIGPTTFYMCLQNKHMEDMKAENGDASYKNL